VSDKKYCKCEVCRGTGQRNAFSLPELNNKFLLRKWDCGYCNGTGKREVWNYPENSQNNIILNINQRPTNEG